MIIMRLIGGLGNQLFQYALGRRLSLERNQDFRLDISLFPKVKNRSYKLDKLNIKASIISKDEILAFTRHANNNIYSLCFRFYQRLLPYYMRRVFSEQKFSYDPNVWRTGKSVYLKGVFQSEKYFLPIRELLREEFTPKITISKEYRQFANLISDSNSVSVHVRRGDYINDPQTNEKHGTCPISYYRDAEWWMEMHLHRPKFFIFSDDMEWAVDNLNFIKNKQFIQNTEKNDDTDIQEMWLMSQCKNHIIANSSFSWWGAWLSNNPEKIVISPKIWFKNSEHNTKDLIPDSWIRL